MTYPTFMVSGDTCEFCEIAAGRLPKTVVREDDDLIVFKNSLTWVPVMYLIAPKAHMTQTEFWRSPLFARASALGVELGESDAPEGFRIVSNFGEQAMQTQPHGHLHLLGGGMLGLYMDFPRKGDFWLRNFGHTEYDPSRPRPNRQQGRPRT
ncbi:MAG: HIT domain-containing protein [Dehalococcoidia bacterium]